MKKNWGFAGQEIKLIFVVYFVISMAGNFWSNKTELIFKSNRIGMVKKLIWLHQIYY